VRLEKWYCDRVDGKAVEIRYRARLRAGPVALGYCGRLDGGGVRTQSVRIPSVRMPVAEGGLVRWPGEAPGGGEGDLTWSGARDCPLVLFQDQHRVLQWNPLVLRGRILRSDGSEAGQGYVERLSMDFAPWTLGIRTLRWGRFCGERHSLVWIAWDGRIARRVALVDGVAAPLDHLAQNAVRAGEAHLALEPGRELVREEIGNGALRPLDWIPMPALRRFFAGVEVRWHAPASLRLPGLPPDRGDVVHEVVTWA
jgi:hypothetical protein